MWYFLLALLLVLAIIMMVLARRNQWETWTIEQANKEIYESRLSELEEDVRQGVISEKERVHAEKELLKTFVTDIHDPDSHVEKKPASMLIPTIILVVLAVGIYIYDGSWKQQQQSDRAHEALPLLSAWLQGDQNAAPRSEEELWTYALGLRQRLMEEPEPNAWSLYGRLMMQVRQLEQALEAFEVSYNLEPDNYNNLMSYSQALIMSGSDHDLALAARNLRQVLQQNNQNVEALGLLGIVHFERADFERAAASWDLALTLMDESDPRYSAIADSLQQAQDRIDGTITTLTVTIDISEALRNEMAWINNLFVFVRNPDGGREPIAVTRQRVTDFPVTVTLTDEDAMLEGVNLSSAASWLVQARLTTGDSMERRRGDFETRPMLIERESGQQIRITLVDMVE
ncbi:MAG: c-type cytochrome biogenesis protein CcmI [Aliidiomarina sp.]|uniref:c-type cytochrome biogenesis protein CcmI n=1 Tax=Aliidiomarina sp. TaxID=1872439 RepID=UPI0025C0AD8C|nr:c-type cytochrome biogenesis protein CcmI [Aliidiomarina sp.]MCH8502226.1 c-type cytochrome biogenesis protein CcmI [Aliidiomarina sp.]